MTKRITTISLAIFGMLVVILLAAYFGSLQNKNNNVINQNPDQNQKQEVKQNPIVALIDIAEVQKHNSAQDCWTIVRGKVYNVTNFAAKHPGGEAAILYNCGKDGTVGFDTRGGKGPHDNSALDILSQYFVANLVTDTGK